MQNHCKTAYSVILTMKFVLQNTFIGYILVQFKPNCNFEPTFIFIVTIYKLIPHEEIFTFFIFYTF